MAYPYSNDLLVELKRTNMDNEGNLFFYSFNYVVMLFQMKNNN